MTRIKFADNPAASTSNQPGVWRSLVGSTITGAYQDNNGRVYLVIDGDCAFGISRDAKFWRESAEDVSKERARLRAQLEAQIAALNDVIETAGEGDR